MLRTTCGLALGAWVLGACASDKGGTTDTMVAADTAVAADTTVVAETEVAPETVVDSTTETVADSTTETVAETLADSASETLADTASDDAPDTVADTADADSAETDTGPALYEATPGTGWHLLWHDEFEGRPCDPTTDACGADAARVAACYDGDANLQHKFHASPGDTVRESVPALADLDKCVWSINNHVNYIHFTNDQKDLIQLYDASALGVSGGELRLGTRFAHGLGPCGTNPDPENPAGQDCPYRGAAVTTIPFHGAASAFPKSAGPYQPGDGLVMPPAGRLEIRAKLPTENGNMAALWTWTVGNPFEHEHDILEYFLNWRSAHHQGDVNYHTGGTSEHGAWVVSPEGNVDRSNEFHTYTVEWEQGVMLRYLFDNQEVAKVTEGEGVVATNGACWAEEVRGNPFYLILWNLMTTYWYAPAAAPHGAGQAPDWLHIDWVRLYERCPTDTPDCLQVPGEGTCEDPCGGYGAWDGTHCNVGQSPAGTSAIVLGGQYAYYSTGPCPYGGTVAAGGCLLGAPPAGRTPEADGNTFRVAPVCTPGEGNWNCARPCPWPGTRADADGCYVGHAPDGQGGFVYNNAFYYEPAASEPRCPYGGTFDSAHCYLGPTPSGAVAVMHHGDYYYEPDHCAYGGTWDRARGACLFFTAPAGRTAFLWEGNAYYQAAAGEPKCEADASFDGANCHVAPLPAGADPFVDGSQIWLAATCGTIHPFANASPNPDHNACDNPTTAP